MFRNIIVPTLAVAGVLAYISNIAPVNTQLPTLSLVQSAHAAEAAAVKYVCPMHPQIISDTPGTCPICGMTLVPMPSGHDHSEGAVEKPVVAIEAGTVQKMGVRTEEMAGGTVPNSAVLRSSDGSHVIVALGEGRFQARDIKAGEVRGGRTAILSGLMDGEKVVTRAEFLIDAESNLRESLNKLEGGEHAGH